MDKQNVVIAALALLILISAMQGLQLSNIQNRLSGYAVAGTNDVQQGDSLSEYDQMMQEMHPEQFKAGTGQASGIQQLPQQIGGC